MATIRQSPHHSHALAKGVQGHGSRARRTLGEGGGVEEREREYCMFKTYSVINRLLFPLIEIRHNLSPTPPFHVRTNLLSATICPLCPVSTTTSDLHRSVRRRRGGGVHFAVGDLGYVRALLVTICKQCCTSPPPPACTSEHVRVFVVHRLFFSRPGGRTVDADGRGWITFIRRHQQKKSMQNKHSTTEF